MLLACAATIALASPALAGSYTAADPTAFQSAVNAAAADGDPSSTVTLTNNVTLSSQSAPAPGKPITIDTAGFTLSRTYANTTTSGVLTFTGPYTSGAYTLNGIITGSDAGVGGNGNGRVGVYIAAQAAAINNGTITGGAGGGLGGAGGTGVTVFNTSTLTNYGTINGGSSTNAVNGGGVGVFVQRGSTVTNYGTIQGGNGQTFGGHGVDFGPPVGVTTLINYGIIRGGTGTTNTGGAGVNIRNGAAPIVNTGTIEGGNNNAAIWDNSAPAVTVINSGTLKAGAGHANAIEFAPLQSASTLTLELQKGSVIQGNVAANSGVTNTFRLGGDIDASFDVSTIGPQYQNFTNFEKTGNSIWTLTGTGGIATPWLVSQGTLQIGDGTATGSIIGNATDNATLAFNRSDAFTFGNVITGSGGITQLGSGTTILTAANTYSGPTTVSAGTLQVDGSIASPTVSVATGGTLVVNGSISSSTVTVATGGTMLVTGSIAGSSAIAVGGSLKMNGTAAASTVTVQSGGSLRGNGTIGATTIQSGGTIAPGNSIGTLHVNGAFTQNAGSVYQVEVDPTSNASDLILVNGAATIQSGATLNVTKNPQGAYRQGAQYTVLTASGGVTGSYALTGDTALSQYLALRESQDAGNIYLSIVQTGDPATAAVTPNQTSVAQAVDSLPSSNSVPAAVLNLPSAAAVPPAFDALSGEALASAKGALISSSLLVRDTMFDHLRDVVCMDGSQDDRGRSHHAGCVAAPGRPSLWMQGFGGWNHVYGNGNAAGVSQTSGGFLTGVDVPVYDWRIGVFGGYSRTDFDVTARASSGASNNYHLGAYGGTLMGDFTLRLGASYSWSAIDTERLVAINAFSNSLRASYNTGTTQVFGEIGRAFETGQVSLEPFANLAYVGLNTDGFSEAGGDAALTSRRDTTQDMFATFGVRPSTEVTLGPVSAVLRGMVGWRHTFGDIAPSSRVSFAGSKDFAVAGAPIAKNSAVVEAGFGADLSSHAAVSLTYGGQFSSEETDHSIRGTITLTF